MFGNGHIEKNVRKERFHRPPRDAERDNARQKKDNKRWERPDKREQWNNFM